MPLTIKRTNTVVAPAYSVLFNGSNQYLSLSRVLDNSTDVTIEAWVRATSTPTTDARYIVAQYLIGSSDRTIFYISTTLTVGMQFGSNGVGSTTAITLNTWYHIAWVRSGSGANNFSIYINGVRDGQMTYTGTFQNVPTTIGGSNNYDAYGSSYFSGYISNLRILKGTALYTGASFTVPTSPLTAIANTQLLICNGPTIIDNSTNNFAITNNNTATVSSTTPFAAASPTNNFQFVNRNNLPIVLAGTQKAIFGYGDNGPALSMTNLVSNTGVVATDTTGVGTARYSLAAAGYGSDKAIFGYGSTGTVTAITNLVSNTGTVSTDTTGVGTAREYLAAAGYGSDKALFGYGNAAGGDVSTVSITNLVSNTGVVAVDTTGVGTARNYLAASGYGSDKALFGYGYASATYLSITNKVSNTGVVSTDTTGVGTIRGFLAAAGYGSDKAIFGYGNNSLGAGVSMTNLVSNTGVVATDTTGVGTARSGLAAAGYGGDKAIFGYGANFGIYSMTNLVSNTGVVATDTTGVGSARYGLAAAGYSITILPGPSGMSLKKVFADPLSIVTSGLVLNLDASNASSYPGSGTSWSDLSGNGNNGTLVNGPTYTSSFGGSIVFDGSNDYATLGTSIPTNLQLGQGNFTIDFWVYPNGTGTYSICGNLNDADGGGSYWVIINSTYNGLHTVQFGYAGLFDSGNGYKFGTTALPINVWSNVILSRIGTTMTCYINGSSYATPITVSNFTGNFNIDYLIGMSKSGGGFTSYPLNGRLSILRIYKNVGFTQSEVLQNYNANKGRFGL